MEYDKQIEIKIDGNNCIINIPSDQNLSSKSLNKILSQNNNSLTNIDDISFSVSLTEENMNSRNNFYNQNYENNKNNNYSNKKSNLYSNEKSKLEITYQSIFYSDLKSDSSNMKTPLLLLNYKNNIETQQKKDSVVKRLNFDLSNSNNSNNNTNNSNTFNYNNSNSNSNSNKTFTKKSAIQSQMILSQGHFYLTHLQNVQIIQVILILVIIQTKIILVKADLNLLIL